MQHCLKMFPNRCDMSFESCQLLIFQQHSISPHHSAKVAFPFLDVCHDTFYTPQSILKANQSSRKVFLSQERTTDSGQTVRIGPTSEKSRQTFEFGGKEVDFVFMVLEISVGRVERVQFGPYFLCRRDESGNGRDVGNRVHAGGCQAKVVVGGYEVGSITCQLPIAHINEWWAERSERLIIFLPIHVLVAIIARSVQLAAIGGMHRYRSSPSDAGQTV